MQIVVVDFETLSLERDLTKVGVSNYITAPDFQVLCMGWGGLWDENIEMWVPPDGDCPLSGHIADGGRLAAFNIGFDRAVWDYLGWPEAPWIDIQALCASENLPMNVQDAALLLLGKGKLLKQDDSDSFSSKNSLIRKLNQGKVELNVENRVEVMQYCRQDVLLEREILKWTGTGLPPGEQEVFEATEAMNRGPYIDPLLAHGAVNLTDRLVREAMEAAENAIREPVERLDFTSRARFTEKMLQRGVELPDCRWETVRMHHNDEDLGVQALVAGRRVCGAGIVRKFDSLIARRNENGRLTNSFKYCGTHTGRWSSVGVQLQNLPRGSLSTKNMNLAVDLVRKRDLPGVINLADNDLILAYDLLTTMIRPCLAAPPGKSLIVADYSSIEARVCVWLAEDRAKIEQYRNGEDMYCDMAGVIFNREITPAMKTERNLGKIAVLGLGYGMGASKAKETFGQDLEKAGIKPGTFVNQFRDHYSSLSSPEIPLGLWQRMIHAVTTCISDNEETFAGKCRVVPGDYTFPLPDGKDGCFLDIILPSGRFIRYWNPGIERNRDKIWETLDISYSQLDRSTFSRVGHDWKPVVAYMHGGKFLENIASGIARDILAHHLVRMTRHPLILPVGAVHDELILEVDNEYATELLEEVTAILSTPPEWAADLPMATEAYLTEYYAKTPVFGPDSPYTWD